MWDRSWAKFSIASISRFNDAISKVSTTAYQHITRSWNLLFIFNGPNLESTNIILHPASLQKH